MGDGCSTSDGGTASVRSCLGPRPTLRTVYGLDVIFALPHSTRRTLARGGPGIAGRSAEDWSAQQIVSLTSINVSLNLGPISLGGTWEPDEREMEAAWEMYIELATRISTQALKEDEGILREALGSLHDLFPITREILRRQGPTVARKKGKSDHSFAELAIYVLNYSIRPVLSKWHPLLEEYEVSRPDGKSVVQHEAEWNRAGELREVLEGLRCGLLDYANLLAAVAGVAPLIALDETASESG
jgi:hypothetical protein